MSFPFSLSLSEANCSNKSEALKYVFLSCCCISLPFIFHSSKALISFDKSGNKLVGFSFVISGVFEFFSRDEIKKSVEDNGGKIVSSVSSKTDYLLMGSGVGPSKIKKADLHGVKRLTENEFLRWIGSSK